MNQIQGGIGMQAAQSQQKAPGLLEQNLNDSHMIVSDLEGCFSQLENQLRRVLDPDQQERAIGNAAPVPVETRLVDEVQTVNIRLRQVIDRITSVLGRLHV